MRSRARLLLGIVAVLVLYTGLQVGRLWPDASAPAVWGATVAVFWAMLSWQVLYFRSRASVLEARWFPALAWPGAILLGAWATFMLFALPMDLGSLARRALGLRGAGPTAHAALALVGAAAAVAALGLWEVLRGPRVVRVAVPVEGLPRGLEGLRIAQISDLHVGPLVRERYVEEVVRAVRALAPDLVAVTGDIADGTVERLERPLRPLRGLKAPLGVYYVTGNHEYYWGAEPWLAKAAELGWTPLVDENRVVARGGAKLLVGGVADPQGAQFVASHASDPRRAAATAERADFKLLLAHRPDACVEAEPAGFDLQLSGHTHGGQFFPFSLLVRFAHLYTRGLHRHGRLWVYVNPGTGFWGPPHRFWVPAEITLLTLERAVSGPAEGRTSPGEAPRS